MARQPFSDTRSVLPPPSNAPKVERFFIFEIARYLRCAPRDLVRLLRREGHLRKLSLGASRAGVWWTSGRGLQIAIAHFRAKQGAEYLKGKDPIAELDKMIGRKR